MPQRKNTPPTIGYFLDQHMGVRCFCNRCHHALVIPLADAVKKLGRDRPFPELARFLRCTICGARDASAMPDWPTPKTGLQ